MNLPVRALFAVLLSLPATVSFAAEIPPTSIEDLRLWLKADAGITTEDNSASGGTAKDVIAWSDQSGHGVTVGPAYPGKATRPAWVESAPELDGKPALQFDGRGGSNFEITDALIGRFKEPFDLNRGTVFLVAKMPAISTISPVTLSATADSKTGRGGVGIRRGGKTDRWFCVHYGGPGNGKKIQSTEAKLDPSFHILGVVFDKHRSSLHMTVDGKPSGATLRDRSKLPLDPIRFVQFGGHGILDPPGEPGAEWFFNGQIAELLVFNRILPNDGSPNASSNQFNAVGHYLQEKYALAGAFVRPIPAVKK